MTVVGSISLLKRNLSRHVREQYSQISSNSGSYFLQEPCPRLSPAACFVPSCCQTFLRKLFLETVTLTRILQQAADSYSYIVFARCRVRNLTTECIMPLDHVASHREGSCAEGALDEGRSCIFIITRSANPKPYGHRAYTQRVCSHTVGPLN